MAKIPSDLKRISSHPVVREFSKQLNVYEKRVRQLVKDLNVSGELAKKRSRMHVEKVSSLAEKARKDVEKKIATLINRETNNINRMLKKRVNELVKSLRAFSEDSGSKKPSVKSKKKTVRRKTAKKKTKRKSKAKKSAKRHAI